MGCSPEECLVIEDSASGITAAINGGFMVFALARESRKEHFQQLGAVTFSNMKELEKLLGLDD
jgi:beta-phosphoglucomutase-like phosphatase (HAD superfamily)